MAPRTDFPPIRACLFDMDGLLLDTEDLYTLCINLVLERYHKPPMPWSVKAKLQGRPAPEATAIFSDWAQLPVPHDQWLAEVAALHATHFPNAKALPGVETLLRDLGRTRYWEVSGGAAGVHRKKGDGRRVHIALATSSHTENFRFKTSHLGELFSVFETPRRVLGDDRRIAPGRGKPLPDIYLLALKTINESLAEGEEPVRPEECLVFEDSVPGIESGRRAGMRVVWCPHPSLKTEFEGREEEILAGRMGEGGEVDVHQLGELGDGWGEYLRSLEEFPYERYGMVIPPPEVEEEECMKSGVALADDEIEVDKTTVSQI